MSLARVVACTFACLFALSISAQTVSFTARQDLATGFVRLASIAVADFNGDGRPDIAATDGYGKRVVVFLNDGAGGFQSPLSTPLSIPNTTGMLVAGDVDEDGKQDLIVSTVAGAQANLVLLGNGDGTFAPAAAMPGSFGFVVGKLVDINGDKHLDFLAGANGSFYVFLGDGKGNFALQPTPPGQANTYLSLTTGDFNRDGKVDFVTGVYGNGRDGVMLSYAGQGNGIFNSPTTLEPFSGTNYDYLASADFNGDGKLDLAFSVPTLGAIALGNGDGTFRADMSQLIFPAQSVGSGSQSATTSPAIAAADFDANGTTDMAFAVPGENHINIALNDGTGTFPQSKPDFSANILPNSTILTTADLNGDGLPDLILGSYSSNTIQIFRSVVVRTTPSVTLAAAPTQSVAGAAVVFSVRVLGSQGVPTGTVTIQDGNTPIGQVVLDGTGQASLTVTTLSANQHTITAAYTGDIHFNSATSAAVVQSVVYYQLAPQSTPLSIVPGGSGALALTVSPLGGLAGTVTLTCSGLPAGYACSGTTISLAGQPVTVNLTVGPATSALASPVGPFRIPVVLALILLPAWPLSRRRANWPVVLPGCLVAFFSVALVAATGCGSSGTNSAATYRGTTTFTVAATTTVGGQTLTHQANATLIVR